MRRKDEITTLYSLASIAFKNENVSIDPLILFFRLIVVVDRMPESEIEDYFSYELSPYPIPTGIYLLKGINRNTRTRCEVCSKLTIKIPE